MSPTTEDLEDRWASLPRPSGVVLEAERLSDWSGGPVYAGVDSDGRRHLLIGLPAGAARERIRPLAGLSVAVQPMRIRETERLWIDLKLIDERGTRAFTSLCADVVESLATASATATATGADPMVVAGVIERWRRFWSPVRDGLSDENQIGLFGELRLLTGWLGALCPKTVRSWEGPLGGRHDFVTSEVSVEVKTTGVATGPVVHRITSLDQLAEPGEGRLYLLSMRVVSDPLGEHSLDRMVGHARASARDVSNDLADDLDERLIAYGWTPMDSGRYDRRLRLASEQLYSVEGQFPRLLISSFIHGSPPAGVQDITYTLDTGACDEWLVASSPSPDGPLESLL